jgi:carbamoyltransferase
MRVLGISAFYHDSAAALIGDGQIIAAAQEERFTRLKHDPSLPLQAIEYCLRQAGTHMDDVDLIVFYDKPFLKFERLLETYLAFAPRGLKSFSKAFPLWAKEKIFQKKLLGNALQQFGCRDFSERILFAEHHLSHAASAFYPSPFERALVLTMDGVGEWATTSVSLGCGKELEIIREIHFPHSLGLLYSAFTYYTGFKVNSGEYKVMGLAPYGKPVFAPQIRDHLIDVKADGSFHLNLDYFDYCTGSTMTNDRFHRLFGGPPRRPSEQLTQRHMDLAASIQVVLDDVVLRLTRSLAAETGEKHLCLAGGVALNAVANGKILRDGQFAGLWIQPASGDAGGALGAALAAYHIHAGKRREVNGRDAMNGAYLGPEYGQEEIEARLTAAGAQYRVMPESCLIQRSAEILAAGQALGWVQGRMEFGPRALGARSILCDPRSPATQSTLNLKVKHRESFRPFAPSVLREHVADWFDLNTDSPYMILVANVSSHRRLATSEADEELFGLEKLRVPRSTIPAVTHVDYSARIQTVHRETHPRYYALLESFYELTGCPVLVNTSFNVRGEPIVCTPEDAFRCFMGTEIDAMAVGNCFLHKQEQNASLKRDHHLAFHPD